MFQSGQTRPESTEREKQAERERGKQREREASREREKQRGELSERGGTDKEWRRVTIKRKRIKRSKSVR